MVGRFDMDETGVASYDHRDLAISFILPSKARHDALLHVMVSSGNNESTMKSAVSMKTYCRHRGVRVTTCMHVRSSYR